MIRLGKAIVIFFTLSDEQRKVVGEKVLELGNIGGGALVFGSALAGGDVKLPYIVTGIAWWFLCFCIYIFQTKSRGEKND